MAAWPSGAVRQRELEIRLESVPGPPRPDPHLEQYRTPPKIAADVLYRALAREDVADRRVADLGCGTGMFAAGAALLGASHVAAIDVDEASVDVARRTLQRLGVEADLRVGPVESLDGTFDTVIMNPPFGAQLAARHLDVRFLEHGLHLAPVTYSLHLEATLPHLQRTAARFGAASEALARYDFPLPAQFRFHTREKLLVRVLLLRCQRMGAP
jgi:putative methylase